MSTLLPAMSKKNNGTEKEITALTSHLLEKKELANFEIEQVVIGSIITNNNYYERVSEFLQPQHFYYPAHQAIYEKIVANLEKSQVANQMTLKQFCIDNHLIKEQGGANYLAELIYRASSIIDIVEYATIIYDLFLKRKLAIIGEDIVINAFDSQKEALASQQIEMAEAKLFELTENSNGKSDFRNISLSLKEALQNIAIARQSDSNISGISTGLIDFDKMLGGMQRSDLIILAGRPSMGKTALAINIAVNACKILNDDNSEKQKAVGFFSLEMSAQQLSARILSMETSVNATKFRTGQIDENEWEVIATRSGQISKLPFFIDDTPALSISAIRTRARRMVRKHNLSLLIIDYLQLIRGVKSRSSDGRVQEISEITQGLKAIAKELNIPVLALSQLSRAVEQREDKRPQLSDLRESGSIEQDADVVAFIYRESYYHERKKPPESKREEFEKWAVEMSELNHLSEVIIAKQRNGPIGNISLYFDAEFTRFNNLDGHH